MQPTRKQLRAADACLLGPYLSPLTFPIAYRKLPPRSHSGSLQQSSPGELPMANLTIKNIPDEVYEQLKQRAARHRRSVNSEVIVCLEKVLGSRSVDPATFLTSIRALRKNISTVFVTEEVLRAAKDEGRL
jgi:plasmid stability protein